MLKQFSISHTVKLFILSPPICLKAVAASKKRPPFDSIALAYFYVYLTNNPIYCYIGNIQGTNIDFSWLTFLYSNKSKLSIKKKK